MTVEDAAQALLVTPEELEVELEAGRLRGFRVAGRWRVTEAAVQEFIQRGAVCHAGMPERAVDPATMDPPARVVGGEPDWEKVTWEEVEPFSHRWPDRTVEEYEEAFRTDLQVGGTRKTVRIGFTNRPAAGKPDRRRVVVFFGDPPATYPVVEFSGANDFDTSGRLASPIKVPGGHAHVRPGDEVPADYAGLPLDIFTNVVSGPYAARSVAVVSDKNDLTLMARHAILRARHRGWV